MQVASERELIAAIEATAVISLAGHRSLQHFHTPSYSAKVVSQNLDSHGFWSVLAARRAHLLPLAKHNVNKFPVP